MQILVFKLSMIQATILILICLLIFPVSGNAYTGPGLGLGSIGVVLGVIGSVLIILFFLFWHSIRQLLKTSNKKISPEGSGESTQEFVANDRNASEKNLWIRFLTNTVFFRWKIDYDTVALLFSVASSLLTALKICQLLGGKRAIWSRSKLVWLENDLQDCAYMIHDGFQNLMNYKLH